MKFKPIKILLCGLTFYSALFAQTFTSSQTLSTTSIDSIEINADNVTLTFTGSSLTIHGDLTVTNRTGVKIVFQNSISSFVVGGETNLSGRSVNGVQIQGNGGAFLPNGNVSLKNTNITGFARALDTTQGSNINIDLEKVYLQGSIYSVYLNGAPTFKARFSKFVSTGTNSTSYTMVWNFTGSVAAPTAEFCYFYKNAGTNHIYLAGSSATHLGTKVCDFEGSNFNGGSTPATNASISYDNNPYATGDPISGTMTFGAAGSGTAGIDYDKIIPPNTVLNIGASITIPSGKYMRLGYDSLATTYPGNSELRVADNQNITIASGASFHSEGNLIAPSGTRWGSLIFEASANSPTVKNTTIRNATIGIADRSDTSYIENSEFTLFAAGSTANYINGSGTYINNRYYSAFQGTPIEIAGGSPKINSNNFTLESGAPFALNIRGGAPYIADNTVNGGGYALDISGGAIGAGQVSRNIFNNPRVKVDNITANLENNYWGAAVPATANFSGSGEIDYEPWWSTSTGAGSTPRQVPVPTYIAPANGAILTSAVDRVTFSIDDIGYHGDAPLEYRLEISQAGDSTFSFPKYSDSASGYARGSTVVHTFPAIGANEYGTYYWRVSVNNTKSDNGNWGTQTAPYSFTIRQPMLNLQLTADKAQASAGEKVTYTLNFSNTETPPTDKLSVVLTAVLPDDVFWNGTLRLITQPDMGTITVKAYSDNGATAQKGATYSSTSAAGTITIPTNSSPGLNIPASEHHTVRRFDVTITKLGSGKAGSLVYETIVK